MSDATLLVPMTLEALVVTKAVQNTVPFRRWSVDYGALQQRADPVGDPMSTTTAPERGVHLRWVLPRALTHAEARPDGRAEFPRVPNRWLVVRFDAPSDSRRGSKAWVVESDYRGEDGTAPYVDENGEAIMIGRCVVLEKWHEVGGRRMALSATGAADLTFAAYHPTMRNVFSFYDAGVAALSEPALMTYLVAGWYSDPTADPLNGVTTAEKLAEFLAQRRWALESPGAVVPKRTVLHAMTHQLEWRGDGFLPQPTPSAQNVYVSVAGTSIDALAAYIGFRGRSEQLEQKLQAFQYDLLETFETGDGRAQLELRIRDAWFGAFPGGTTWHIVDARDDAGRTPVPPTDAQNARLAELNVKQRRLDETSRLALTLQQELHDLMWKRDRLGRMPISDKDVLEEYTGIYPEPLKARIAQALDPSDPNGLVARVKSALDEVGRLTAELPSPTATAEVIADWAKKNLQLNPLLHLLEPHALPPFRQPTDPVVLMANIPMPAEQPDPLPCRLPSQAVTGVRAAGVDVRASNMRNAMPSVTVTALGDVADAAKVLIGEAFFVDPSNASSIIRNGTDRTSQSEIDALAAAMREQRAQLSTIQRPLAAARTFAQWKQAWSPLFLIWTVKWFSPMAAEPTGPPAPEPGNDWRATSGQLMAKDDWPFDFSRWQLDTNDGVRARGSEYFVWKGDRPAAHQSYTGRSVITPQSTRLFIDRIDSYLAAHPGDESMKDVRAILGNSPFISQALGGFNDELIARTRHQSPPPASDPLAPFVGEEYQTIPFTSKGDLSPHNRQVDPAFFPIRGGFFYFEQLFLVDAFGQAIDLLKANNNAGEPASFAPIRGRGLVPQKSFTESDRSLQLAPRYVQPTRLEMRLVSARDDQQELDFAPGVNPICGWVLYNFFDGALELYDAGGRAFGTILPSGTFERPDIVWERAPGSSAAADSPQDIERGVAKSHVRDLVTALFDIPARRKAFDALKEAIDKRLWTIHPSALRPSYASLIGRPLAIVRARVRFQLAGLPAANQSWRTTPIVITNDVARWNENARQLAQFTSFEVPVRIGSEGYGDDGVIGYYGDNYQSINVVRPPQPGSVYARAIANDNLLTIKPGATKWITLMTDPNAEVHATTGVLPVTWMSIPDHFINVALREIAAHFRVGPLLANRDQVRLPRPSEQNGTWQWIRRSGTGEQWDRQTPLWHDETARLPETPERLIDGWLQFTPKTK